MLSPPASAGSPASTNVSGLPRLSRNLPTPRHRPLPPGSLKETQLIDYLDNHILRVSRRYGKKFSNERTDNDDTPGYTSFDQVVADVDPLVDVAWISGTPTLQTPYLLSLAGILCTYMPAFSFSSACFPILAKLDHGFLALLRSSEAGFNTASHTEVSMTDRVRMKSLVEDTRITAVKVASGSGYSASVQDLSLDDDDDVSDTDTDTDVDMMDDAHDPDPNNDRLAASLGRIYKQTLEILGDAL